MKKTWFYLGLGGLVAFEIAKVYFIMPMPGSQRMNSLDFAYFLHTWRWGFRGLFALLAIAGARDAFGLQRKWLLILPVLALVPAVGIAWFFNFKMSADHMFQEPVNPVYLGQDRNAVDAEAVVIGVEHNGEARAYPVRFIVYHHQVRDTVGGKPVMVTYCSVCRTGRVFDPAVNGQPERFRLVGMDHFNAMFEDATTGSWWRQVNGEAVTGRLKGARLAELPFTQMTLKRWFELHPAGKVLQADGTDPKNFDVAGRFERGESKSLLTGTNPGSWEEKSWVLGVEVGTVSKAYDWNRLKATRVINDEVGGTPVVLVLAQDGRSFAAFERPADATFTMDGDTIVDGKKRYDFSGREVNETQVSGLRSQVSLRPIKASQEFWHSWRTFHPDTLKGK
jgi:hypothetical protein